MTLPVIDIPFNQRHCCWFCGEPATKLFSFPKNSFSAEICCHDALSVPSCGECSSFANKSHQHNIWLISSDVKKHLLKKYQKHLAIGINWTQEELANSQFEGGNFASFQKSAWFMYEVAQQRVNYIAWPLSLNGLDIEHLKESSLDSFSFDGVNYPSIEDAISHYVETFALNDDYLRQVLHKMGINRFAAAVRFCRLMVDSTPNERRVALKEL